MSGVDDATGAAEVSGPAAEVSSANAEAGVARVVLVHGFTQSARSWSHVEQLLADSGLRVSTWELPGHGDGGAAARGDATGAHPSQAADHDGDASGGGGAVGVRDDLDLVGAAELLGAAGGRATYVGYSMGGRICLHLAMLRPDLVERLILVGVTAGIEDLDAREERRASDDALADELESGGDAHLAEWIDRWLAGPLFAHLTDEQADRPARLGATAGGLAAALRHLGTGTQRPLWEELRRLEMPVLVLAGEHDPKFVAIGERLARAIGANATFVLVPGTGHAVPFEAPGPFAALTHTFADGNRGHGGTAAGEARPDARPPAGEARPDARPAAGEAPLGEESEASAEAVKRPLA